MATRRELTMGEDVLTPLLSQEQSEEDLPIKVKLEWDILREPSPDKMIRKLTEVSEQGRETVGSIVPVSTISGTIFYQLIKRAVAVSDEPEINSDNDTNGENSEENI